MKIEMVCENCFGSSDVLIPIIYKEYEKVVCPRCFADFTGFSTKKK